MQPLNVMNAPKTSTFQMRINPEIKAQVYQSGVFDTGEYETEYEKSLISKDLRGVSLSRRSL